MNAYNVDLYGWVVEIILEFGNDAPFFPHTHKTCTTLNSSMTKCSVMLHQWNSWYVRYTVKGASGYGWLTAAYQIVFLRTGTAGARRQGEGLCPLSPSRLPQAEYQVNL